MTKTFVIRLLANAMYVKTFGGNNPTAKVPLKANDIQEFKDSLQETKELLYSEIKPMLKKGGWIFDPTLWKWEFQQPDIYTINLWVTITFLGYDGEPKDIFMYDINRTGILSYDHTILKNYS